MNRGRAAALALYAALRLLPTIPYLVVLALQGTRRA